MPATIYNLKIKSGKTIFIARNQFVNPLPAAVNIFNQRPGSISIEQRQQSDTRQLRDRVAALRRNSLRGRVRHAIEWLRGDHRCGAHYRSEGDGVFWRCRRRVNHFGRCQMNRFQA